MLNLQNLQGLTCTNYTYVKASKVNPNGNTKMSPVEMNVLMEYSSVTLILPNAIQVSHKDFGICHINQQWLDSRYFCCVEGFLIQVRIRQKP